MVSFEHASSAASVPDPHRTFKERPEARSRPKAPSAARQMWISGVMPVSRAYAVRTASAKSPARSVRTRLTVQPAQPAPESFPPRKPGAASAASIRASSAGELFSKSSRLEACEADISRPNATTSPDFSASTPARTRSFSLRTCRARLRPTGRGGSQSASSCSSGTHESRNSPRWGIRSRNAATTRSHSARLWSYIPSARRREVLESHTTIAGAGLPRGKPVVHERAAIEEQGMIGPSEQAGELVEQARADPHEFVLRAPEGLGQLHAMQVARCRA